MLIHSTLMVLSQYFILFTVGYNQSCAFPQIFLSTIPLHLLRENIGTQNVPTVRNPFYIHLSFRNLLVQSDVNISLKGFINLKGSSGTSFTLFIYLSLQQMVQWPNQLGKKRLALKCSESLRITGIDDITFGFLGNVIICLKQGFVLWSI